MDIFWPPSACVYHPSKVYPSRVAVGRDASFPSAVFMDGTGQEPPLALNVTVNSGEETFTVQTASLPSATALIVTVPAFTAVTVPSEDTVAIPASDVVQVTVLKVAPEGDTVAVRTCAGLPIASCTRTAVYKCCQENKANVLEMTF